MHQPPKSPSAPGTSYELELDQIAEDLGGSASLMEIARHCQDEEVQKVVALWEGLEDPRQTAGLDQLCQDAGVRPSHVLGQVMAFLWSRSVDTIKLIAAVQMPAVMMKTIERALGPDGFRDRKMVMEHVMPAYAPRTHPARVLRGQASKTPGSDQDEGSLDYPRVEDDNAVDRIFRDLDGE